MRALGIALLAVVVATLLLPASGLGSGATHYQPRAGDRFAYSETMTVTGGTGNYTGYSDQGQYTGSISVASVAPNGTANATYQASGTYSNSLGASYPWSESGSFSFSGSTFRYVHGTDNQTGYSNPSVWFFMNASLARGSTFQSLNTAMAVVSTNTSYPDSGSSTGYVAAIFAEGNGTYQRHDAYGTFTANYNWKEYFDVRTGYVLGYVDSETDSDGAGDGFTYTDTVSDTSTSFPLTPAVAPVNPGGPGSPASGSSGSGLLLYVVIGVVLLIVVVVVVVLLARRSRSTLPRHATAPTQHTMPSYGPPPPLNLTPGNQPAVQQVVIRETVKVPCRFCATLMDSTATNCPNCGAPRT